MTGSGIIGLSHAISGTFVTFPGDVAIEILSVRPWASVTFTGARHHLRLYLRGDGAVGVAADFLERLPDLDLPVAGHIVADIALLADARSDRADHAELELEVLTIRDA